MLRERDLITIEVEFGQVIVMYHPLLRARVVYREWQLQ